MGVVPLAALLLLGTSACRQSGPEASVRSLPVVSPPAPQTGRAAINPRLLRRFRPVFRSTVVRPSSPELVSLGHLLFFEPRLSRSGTTSCNSCHRLGAFGVDHRPTSVGERGQTGRRNAPTVYNAAEHLAQFWDGRARDVEEQAAGPILNPAEMASTRESVEATLRAIPEYRRRFGEAFPADADPITLTNVGRALGAFERQLVTHSRWDDYLKGRKDALSPDEVEGLRVFLDVGCMGCHTGPQVGASMYQVAGFVEPWPNQSDLGRYEVTKIPSDRMVFKVPTMKNITHTAPYFHDGSVDELSDAVRTMGRHQLGIELSGSEVASIVAFLGALEGELPAQYVAPPRLPAAVLAKRGG